MIWNKEQQHHQCIYHGAAILWLLGCVFFLSLPVHAATHRVAVWSILNGSTGGSQLFLSEQYGDTWNLPTVIATSQSIIVRPVIVGNDHNTIWIVWENMGNGAEGLSYLVRREGHWIKPESLKLKTTANREPTMALDQTGKVWLFWSGEDGIDREIYAAPWHNGKWGEAEQVSANPMGPDRLPEAYRMADGKIRVRWTGYDGVIFRQFEGWKNGSQWSRSAQSVAIGTMSRLLKMPEIAFPISLPARTQLCLFNFDTGVAEQFILRDSLPAR